MTWPWSLHASLMVFNRRWIESFQIPIVQNKSYCTILQECPLTRQIYNFFFFLIENVSCSGPFFVKVGWAASCGIGPEYSGYESWDRSNCNSTWSGLCTNYASPVRSTLMAGKTVSNELRQADMIIIIKSNILRSLLRWTGKPYLRKRIITVLATIIL